MYLVYIKLFSLAIIPSLTAIAIIIYLKYTSFGKYSYFMQQLIIGIIYGIIAILSTEYGIDISNKAVGNIRDSAPLIAGLVFGGPAGIIAGIIGGVERYFSVYWGKGAYTQIACSFSTIASGFFAAYLRKELFNHKFPLPIFGFVAGVIIETFHMTMVLITHISDSETAFEILNILSLPMISATSFSIFFTLLVIKKIFIKDEENYQSLKNISTKIQLSIIKIVTLALIITSLFTYILHTNSEKTQTEQILNNNLNIIKKELNSFRTESDIYILVGYIDESSKLENIDGYIAVFDENKKLISGAQENIGKSMTEIGLIINDNINNHTKEFTIMKADIFGVPSHYCYTKYSNYYIVAYMQNSEVFLNRDNNFLNNSYMEILVYAFIFLLLFYIIKKNVVEKINEINDGLKQITQGNMDTIINVTDTKEFESLSNDINSTVSALKQHINNEKERIAKDLMFAKKIQSSSLPSFFPAFPGVPYFDIYATMRTAKEVGGDFYDFYFCEKDILTFLIADVTGKGIPAAMFMMTAKTMIKNFSSARLDITDIVNKVNNELCNGNDAGMFVTAFIGQLNIKTGHIDFVNSGHNPPLIIKNKHAEYLDCYKDFVLAGFEDYEYKKQTIDLNPGDRLYLYTDGVTEAMNKQNELYNEKRLINLFNNKLKNKNIYETLKEVQNDIDIFVNDAEQADDITMLEIVFNGGK